MYLSGSKAGKTEQILAISTILLVLILFLVKQKGADQKTLALTSVNPRQVTSFRIFPRVIRPVGGSIEFTPPDALITEFFQSLTDIHSYRPSHDTLDSQDYQWFLELTTREGMIQISFHIPSGKGNIVAGEFGRWGKSAAAFSGDFQSRKLFQWYQKYKDRWLQPAPAKQKP